MGLRPITWGMGWGDVPRPAESDEQAPFDVALLAPFDRRPVLTADELLGLVGAKFAEAGAPVDLARVEQWLANAEARNLVEVRDGTGSAAAGDDAYVITQRGERRLRSVRFAGLAVITTHPFLGLIARFALPVAVIVTGFTLGAVAAMLFFVIIALLVLAVVTMSRRDRKPLVLRKAELAAAHAAPRQEAEPAPPASAERTSAPAIAGTNVRSAPGRSSAPGDGAA